MALQPQQVPTFSDRSENFFSFYSKLATEEDDKSSVRLQKDAQGIIIFAGLFSAALAALLAVSVQDLKQDFQQTSATYLVNIYQLLADPNATVPRTSIPSTIVIPPPFSPPRQAIWVNSLWFLSLVISLTCALLATSLQQWARLYIANARPQGGPLKNRARIRTFFANGIDENPIPLSWVVEALPALLHLSVFLFFAGLIIFLFNIDHIVFIPMTTWIVLFLIVYGCFTFMPFVLLDSPYHSPFSSVAWSVCTRLQYSFFAVLASTSEWAGWDSLYVTFANLKERYRDWISKSSDRALEDAVSSTLTKIDLRILEWTLDALSGDDSLEQFFEFIPGFFLSLSNEAIVQADLGEIRSDLAKRFWETFGGFFYRTLSSSPLLDEVRNRRLNIFGGIMEVISCPVDISNRLFNTLKEHLDQASPPIEMAQLLAHWTSNPILLQDARDSVVRILATVQKRDDRWKALAAQQFGLPTNVLQNYIDRSDDSALLYLLNHVIRQANGTHPLSTSILSSLSKLNIMKTDHQLQHEFFGLWYTNVQRARAQPADNKAVSILRCVRRLCLDLHPGTKETHFNADTGDDKDVLFQPISCPVCGLTITHPANDPFPP